ncbi:MAG: transcriptional regulator [Thaumarchaeota archaeon]|jgi:predicted DNA-binding transcriptional regulator|nr:transcriptional regulator [Candidatus Geocrenenecus arthurdayi]
MSRDQVIGVLLMFISIAVIIGYAWILFFTEWTLLLMQVTLMVAVAALLGIIAWIGYTLATTPPPKPIEEIEKEIQQELETLEKRTEESGQEKAGREGFSESG